MRVFGIIAALLIAGCATVGTPEETSVRDLTQRGFTILSDGRNSPGATTMIYAGAVSPVAICGVGRDPLTVSNLESTESINSGASIQRVATADALIKVGDDGALSGQMAVKVVRSVVGPSGRVVAREATIVPFVHGRQGRNRMFRCQSRL
jgi:hypothetical protein